MPYAKRKLTGRRMNEANLSEALRPLTDAQSLLLQSWDMYDMPATIADSMLRGRSVDSLTNKECIALKTRGRELFFECSRAWETLET